MEHPATLHCLPDPAFGFHLRALNQKKNLKFIYGSGLVIGDEGTKLENCVAVNLLKQAFSLEDETGQRTRLDQLQTTEEREMEFCFFIFPRQEQLRQGRWICSY